VALIDQIAERVVSLGMTVPAILFVESSKPLSFIGSQFLYFFEPVVKSLIKGEQYTRFARLLEERENVEVLLSAIERKDAEMEARRRVAREAEKKRRAEEKARKRLMKEGKRP
jgi:hypothetical protein